MMNAAKAAGARMTLADCIAAKTSTRAQSNSDVRATRPWIMERAPSLSGAPDLLRVDERSSMPPLRQRVHRHRATPDTSAAPLPNIRQDSSGRKHLGRREAYRDRQAIADHRGMTPRQKQTGVWPPVPVEASVSTSGPSRTRDVVADGSTGTANAGDRAPIRPIAPVGPDLPAYSEECFPLRAAALRQRSGALPSPLRRRPRWPFLPQVFVRSSVDPSIACPAPVFQSHSLKASTKLRLVGRC